MKKLSFIVVILVFSITSSAQLDSTISKISFESDFRFRVEQDWDSRRSDGTFRDDRTRFRYRLRAGVGYADKWYSFGFRVRTGTPNKQQDPQLTLGAGFEEFGTLPIGLEKAYFQGKWNTFKFWVGKNTFPFEKSNELFWSDNVFPEGIFAGKGIQINSSFIDSLNVRAGHFILSASGQSLSQDSYFQGYQTYIALMKKRVELFPSFYYFKNIPNIPDGNEMFVFDYSIFHLGTRLDLIKNNKLSLEFDYYHNLEDYTQNDSIPTRLKDQKSGYVVGLKHGVLKQKGDWQFAATYTNLEQYSAVDFMAQNDWARWDYSALGSPDGRLTNMQGIELVAGYKLDEKINLKMKYYLVEQPIPYGSSLETGNRIRLDIDISI